MSNSVMPYTVSNKMLNLVSEISEKMGVISCRKGFDSNPKLKMNNRINSIHSSLKIDSHGLTQSEIRDIIYDRPVLCDAKDIQRVKNTYAAYKEMANIDPSDLDELKRIHGIMTSGTSDEPGAFRKTTGGVFSGNKCVFVAPPPEMIEELMGNLFSWLKENKDVVHPLILAAVFQYGFLFIHPFENGNGRMARLWHTVILYRWKNIFEFIPLESQMAKFSRSYYDTIAKCHENGNSEIFIEYMLEKTNQILDETIIQLTQAGEDFSEYVRRLMECMEYDTPYTSNQILDRLGLKSKETLRKNYLNPALDLGLIEMTLPDKPNSRNQRYIKK